ncbi:sulfotransferase [Bizionia hallyeonensis]|uniref:Sulfotransferase n=1 Tax=Bizionia hallyeonensis TaxID=1123757 RepID=A0ABW0C729_9FLAO
MFKLKPIKKALKPKIIQLALRFKHYNMADAIIIFSEARGGSTWLMELLKHIPGVIINWEPLHVNRGVVPKAYKLGWRPCILPDSTDTKHVTLFSKIFRFSVFNTWTTRYVFWKDLKHSKHVLTKFVRANQSLPWVVATYPELKHKPVFLLRHPIATCLSRLKTFEGVDAQNITTLTPAKKFDIPDCINNMRFIEHQHYIDSLQTQLEVEIAVWCVNNVDLITHKNQDTWYTLYYEDLVMHPEDSFQALLQGINIHLPQDILSRIDYRKPSSTNFYGNLKALPKHQLESFLNKLEADQLRRIQGVFDYFDLKVYSAFSAYPIKKT